MKCTVYIEESKIPVYRRVAYALGAQFMRSGYCVLVVKPGMFTTTTFQDFLSKQDGAVYITNAEKGDIIQSRVPGRDAYYFESFPGKLVFLHQDIILGGTPGLLDSISKLQAWKRVAERSLHLCLEPWHVVELKSVGIPHAKRVPHATEIEPAEPLVDEFSYGTTFVGHALPSSYAGQQGEGRMQRLVAEAYRLRCTDLSRPIEELVQAFADGVLDGIGDPADRPMLRVACSHWFRQQVCGTSMAFRGWIFENCGIDPLTIFGGDAAYLHGVVRTPQESWTLQVHRPGVSYRPATHVPHEVQGIFRTSRVSINITSLQFDHAVGNRFHDVIMSGGLCLTDARSGLAELTSVHAQVTYRTVEELRDRAAYFSRPQHARERSLLIKTIQTDIQKNSGYPLLVDAMADWLREMGA